jgi:hypothetical protein
MSRFEFYFRLAILCLGGFCLMEVAGMYAGLSAMCFALYLEPNK